MWAKEIRDDSVPLVEVARYTQCIYNRVAGASTIKNVLVSRRDVPFRTCKVVCLAQACKWRTHLMSNGIAEHYSLLVQNVSYTVDYGAAQCNQKTRRVARAGLGRVLTRDQAR